ncbi:hypothetical protein D3C81_28590 [compost metagenome]
MRLYLLNLILKLTFKNTMVILSNVIVILIAAIHLYILILEMFLWQTPTGRRVFATTVEFAAATRVLAANQGLYNGFLAAGLAWGVWRADPTVQLFFLGCVLVAGIFGGLTASRKILKVQALPALIAILVVIWAH